MNKQTKNKLQSRYEKLEELKGQKNARSYDYRPTMLYANVKIHHTPYNENTIDALLEKSTMTEDDIVDLLWGEYGLVYQEAEFLRDWWKGYEYNSDEPEAKKLELLREYDTKDRAGYFNGRSGGWFGVLELDALENLLKKAEELLEDQDEAEAEDSLNTFDRLLETAEWAIEEIEHRANNLDLTYAIEEHIEEHTDKDTAEQEATVALCDAIRHSTLFDSVSDYKLNQTDPLTITRGDDTFTITVSLTK